MFYFLKYSNHLENQNYFKKNLKEILKREKKQLMWLIVLEVIKLWELLMLISKLQNDN